MVLEDYVFCGPSMVFTNILNPRCEFPQKGSEFYKKTFVKRGASLGANSTIVCGNNIGKRAFVGAGAVVTKDVPDYVLATGNPAKTIGWMCACATKLDLSLNPDTVESAVCKKCGKKYKKMIMIIEETG